MFNLIFLKVPIIDAGIKYYENASLYNIYQKGIENDCFIKSNITKKPLINLVWPGESVYFDYNHPMTQ